MLGERGVMGSTVKTLLLLPLLSYIAPSGQAKQMTSHFQVSSGTPIQFRDAPTKSSVVFRDARSLDNFSGRGAFQVAEPNDFKITFGRGSSIRGPIIGSSSRRFSFPAGRSIKEDSIRSNSIVHGNSRDVASRNIEFESVQDSFKPPSKLLFGFTPITGPTLHQISTTERDVTKKSTENLFRHHVKKNLVSEKEASPNVKAGKKLLDTRSISDSVAVASGSIVDDEKDPLLSSSSNVNPVSVELSNKRKELLNSIRQRIIAGNVQVQIKPGASKKSSKSLKMDKFTATKQQQTTTEAATEAPVDTDISNSKTTILRQAPFKVITDAKFTPSNAFISNFYPSIFARGNSQADEPKVDTHQKSSVISFGENQSTDASLKTGNTLATPTVQVQAPVSTQHSAFVKTPVTTQHSAFVKTPVATKHSAFVKTQASTKPKSFVKKAHSSIPKFRQHNKFIGLKKHQGLNTLKTKSRNENIQIERKPANTPKLSEMLHKFNTKKQVSSFNTSPITKNVFNSGGVKVTNIVTGSNNAGASAFLQPSAGLPSSVASAASFAGLPSSVASAGSFAGLPAGLGNAPSFPAGLSNVPGLPAGLGNVAGLLGGNSASQIVVKTIVLDAEDAANPDSAAFKEALARATQEAKLELGVTDSSELGVVGKRRRKRQLFGGEDVPMAQTLGNALSTGLGLYDD